MANLVTGMALSILSVVAHEKRDTRLLLRPSDGFLFLLLNVKRAPVHTVLFFPSVCDGLDDVG